MQNATPWPMAIARSAMIIVSQGPMTYDNCVALSCALHLTTQNSHLLRQWLVVIVLHLAISVLYQVKNAGLASGFCFAFC